MPLVKVDLFKGKTEEEKNKLIKGISEAFLEIGIPKDKVHVILNEVPLENWGFNGEPATKWFKK